MSLSRIFKIRRLKLFRLYDDSVVCKSVEIETSEMGNQRMLN